MEQRRDYFSVAEAARALGLSERRIRALIHAGALAAQHVGGRWLVSRADVEQRARHRGRPGRPLGERNAWARSEERRVGKECRSRWSREKRKKKERQRM